MGSFVWPRALSAVLSLNLASCEKHRLSKTFALPRSAEKSRAFQVVQI